MEIIERPTPNLAILELKGRFDAHEQKKMLDALDRAIRSHAGRVLVNLSGVHFVDSSGLAALVQGMKRCRQNQGDLWLCSLQQPVRIIFELTRFDKAFEIYGDEPTALAAITG